jgi:DivIVA domain-containing protein
MAGTGEPPSFTIVLRGYDRAQVDGYLADLRSGRRSEQPPPHFDRVLRGYSTSEVDAHIRQVRPEPAGDGDGQLPAPPVAPRFTIVLRGYDRRQVDRFLAEAQARIVELERVARHLGQPPDTG